MKHKGVILLGRLTSNAMLLNPDTIGPGVQVYDRGLRLAPKAPVLVDHDQGQAIGRVVELVPFDQWLSARVVFDERPDWLRKGSGASVGHIGLRRQPLGAGERIIDAYVTEISVLSPSMSPANRGARVELLEELVDGPEPAKTRPPMVGYPAMSLDALYDAHFGRTDRAAARLIRPAIGRVLGVR